MNELQRCSLPIKLLREIPHVSASATYAVQCDELHKKMQILKKKYTGIQHAFDAVNSDHISPRLNDHPELLNALLALRGRKIRERIEKIILHNPVSVLNKRQRFIVRICYLLGISPPYYVEYQMMHKQLQEIADLLNTYHSENDHALLNDW